MADPLPFFMVAEHGLTDAITDLATWCGGFLADAETRLQAGEDPSSLIKSACQGVDIGLAKVGGIATAIENRIKQIETGVVKIALYSNAPTRPENKRGDF